jgi:hypothetical protein
MTTDKPIPRDIILYDKIKNEISNKYKHSAYRSGLIVKKYKNEYSKKYNRDDAYIGEKPKLSNLSRWFLEEWTTDRGDKGYKYKNDIYRPTKRINKDTPITLSELTKDQIIKAKKEKATTGRVKRFQSY